MLKESILIYPNAVPVVKANNAVFFRRVFCGMLVIAVGLSACGSKEKKAGQALVRVNGEEITVLQVNDELSRAGVQPGQQEAATKQLLEAMIDRQLILSEAMRNKIDRTPDVMKAIERAKAQIITQAYLQSITAKVTKPSKAEINDYFQKHPEYFAQRKQFDVKQLVLASKDFSDKLKQVVDSAKTLEAVASWMDGQSVKYARGQLSRSTADIPPELGEKLGALHKGEMFIIKQGENTLINILVDIKDVPVTAENAAPKIEQYLINKKNKEVADAEITHLRSSAKIEYLNAQPPAANQGKPAAPTPDAAAESKPVGAAAESQAESGVVGIK